MSTIRYARESHTSAQRAANDWQRKVEEKRRLLAIFDAQVAGGRPLSARDMRRYNLSRAALMKLLANDPNEAA